MISKTNLSKFKILLYSTLARLKFNLGGQLGVNEIIAVVDSLNPKSWKRLYSNIPDIRLINAAYLGILISQIVSDLVNQSSSANYARGWANILMAIIVTNFLSKVLWENSKSIVYYLLGSMATIVFFGADVEEFVLEEMGFFKFTVAPILNSLLLVLAWYWLRKSVNNRIYIISLFAIYGLFNLVFDYRSNGLIFLMISFFLYKKNILKKIKIGNVVPYIIAIVVVFQGFYIIYVDQVLSGSIGGEHSVEQLRRLDNPYNPINLLMTGRSETIVAMIAVSDKPIFGHGSWAPDPGGKYTLMAYQMHGNEDRFDLKVESGTGQFIIPSHSVLIGIWMTAGVGGFILMVYIIILLYRRAFKLVKAYNFQKNPSFPILLFFITNGAWIFMFSPLPHIKQSLPIIIAFIIVSHRKAEIEYSKT